MQKIKDFVYYNRKEIITVIICIVSFFSFNIFNSNDEVITKNIIEKENIEEKKEFDNSLIVIDIKGEVLNPGTYEFELGKRIIDAIEKSGGLTEKANVNSINLSEKLEDEMVIIVPSFEEEINNENNQIISNKKEEIKESKISINTANKSLLMTLKGIGEKKAEAIIDYREKNGPFKTIEEITNVTGIGNSIFDKIKDFIKV